MGCKFCSDSADNDIPYHMFIGRFQPPHKGHQWLFERQLKEGNPVLIAVRNIPPDKDNLFTTKQIIKMLRKLYEDQPVQVISIPNIAGVNFGNKVGYEINEWIPPEDIKIVSSTAIMEGECI
jgi:adenylylsulfate kinase